jgi:multidrug resistance efflux pump
MEILLLLIYAGLVWFVFIKKKWLPWTFVTQVLVVTFPVVALTILILFLNIYAPESGDVRVMNYVVPVIPRVTGRVIEVPVEANRPVKKGDVLFKLDPVPFQIEVDGAAANLKALQAKLLSVQANASNLSEQLKEATGKREALSAKLGLARKRAAQYQSLAATGAGTKFDLEQAQTNVQNLENELASSNATVAQVKETLSAKTADGEQNEVAQAKAQIVQAQAQLDDANWKLDQTVYYAPGNGTVVGLALRPGAIAAQLPMLPVMSFVLNEQWVVALFDQNEVRKVEPGNRAEIALKTYPGRIIKCVVSSVVWATAQGQLPISGNLPNTGTGEPVPEGRLAVKLQIDDRDKDLFLAAGARGSGAIYTNGAKEIQILRRVLLRIHTKLNWLILKL